MPRFNVEVSVNDLAFALSDMDQVSFVEAVRIADGIIAEVEFTQWLVMTLVEELSCDLTPEEKSNFISNIKEALN
jgi:hypothetical protein